jgi:hypothetical protein
LSFSPAAKQTRKSPRIAQGFRVFSPLKTPISKTVLKKPRKKAETPREPTSLDTPRDTTKTRELYLQQASDKKKTLCQIMPTMMPTEKVLFGVDLLFNDEGEHVITKVWDGSPAAKT